MLCRLSCPCGSDSSDGTSSTSSDGCCVKFPYGVVALAVSYLAFVLLVEFLSPVDCLGDAPCNSEGLDNSILGWATDYYIAFMFFVFGFHLWWTTTRVRRRGQSTGRQSQSNDTKSSETATYWSAIIALWSMGVAYVLGGIGHSVYTNSGFDDNAGQQGFYIVWAISFSFMTLSVEETMRFIRRIASEQNNDNDFYPQCVGRFLAVSFWLVVAAWIPTTGGYIWCASIRDIHVDGTVDTAIPIDETPEDDQLNTCLQVAAASELSWYGTFALFWTACGFALRSLVLDKIDSATDDDDQHEPFVYGFSMRWASILLMVIQWTFGIMLIVWSVVASVALDLDATQAYEDIYGAVVYHFGMLLCYFLFHNMVLWLTDMARPIRSRNGQRTAPEQRDSVSGGPGGGSLSYALPY